VILGKQGRGTDGALSLKIEPGKPTAHAAGILASWLGRNKSKRTAAYSLLEAAGTRIDSEITDLGHLRLVFFWHKRMKSQLGKRSDLGRRLASLLGKLRTKLIDENTLYMP